MRSEAHPRDEELLLAIDGELPETRAGEVVRHLAHCWTCRARAASMERSIEGYVRIHKSAAMPAIPRPEGPAAKLRASLAQAAGERRSQFDALRGAWVRHAIPISAAAAIAAAIPLLLWMTQQKASAGPLPDVGKTPGAARSISRSEVCAAPADDDAREIPVELAHRVFQRYKIDGPKPRAYEVDYLISPALGGAGDIRNLWPQPYADGVWNSRVKDALEDDLRRKVCAGEMELAEAQQAIAANWIEAYKRHFRTERPLAGHALFVKDRPWE